nr:hypothetical protein [Tanacetum cinerariifolium]
MTFKTHNWSSSAHQELHKTVKDEIFPIINQVDARVQNFEIQFLKEAAKFVGDFKSLVKEADESLAKYKALELEIERLLRAVVSQDIMSVVLNYAKENAHLKTTYKNLFDSISVIRTQTKTIIDSLQNKLHDTIYENAKLRAQLFDTVSDQKDTSRGTSANTKYAKQSILGKPPKAGETHALSKPVTSNSIPTPQGSKVVKNSKVIALRMFRMTPFKPSREENYVPNKVRASIKTNSITVSQPPVITKKVKKKANVSINKKQKKQQPKVKKTKKVGSIERLASPKPSKPRSFLRWSPTGRMFDLKGKINASSKSESQSDCSKGDNACTSNPLEPTIKRNDHVDAILGFGDLQWGNILITRVYFIKGLGYNLFSVGQFCDSDLEVAFRRNACFVRNIEGVDLLKGNSLTNLYTINLREMAYASPICLMARASSTKSWLWHQHLSHLNFDTINDLAKNDLVFGLLKFKYHKEHLCPSCEQGKSKRASHPPTPILNSRQRLHLLHMDLCGPMRIASINGKQYALVIVDNYSRYTWVSSVRTPQQNRVVEQQNQTLVEAARTILIFSRAPLFLWAEAIATTCFTQNRSIIHRRFNKTPYELINRRKPDISFLYVFRALCYLKNDREDIGKLGAKGLDLTYAPSTITTQQPTEGQLDLLFEAMYDDYIGGQPSTTSQIVLAAHAHQVHQATMTSTSIADTAPTPTNSSSQATNFSNTSQDVEELNSLQQHAQQQRNQAPIQPETVADIVSNAMFDANTFVNPFATLSTSAAESSLQYVDPSNMHTNQLRSDGDTCMYALTVSTMEPKNVKDAMTDPAWIESMQEELLQFKRLDGWEHLCSSCEQGKRKRASHPPKPVPNSRKRLHLLHMDLCGSMRIASINGKRVFNRRTKKIMETMNVSFDELSAMAFEQRSSKPRLQSMTSGQISSGLDLTYAPSAITTQQPTEDSTPTPTNSSSQATNLPNTSQDVDELNSQQQHVQQQENQAPIQPETVFDNVLNAMFDANTFVNPFATPSTSADESSFSQYVDPSSMHTNQLQYDGDMCMYALTVSTMEPKNVKDAMTDPAWIESMQEELLQFKRLDVWVLVPALDNITPLTLKWLFKNKHDEEQTVSRMEAIRIFLAYAAHKSFTVFQMDVKTAFLH